MLSIFNLSGGTAQSGRSHCSIQAEPLLNFAGRADFAERRTQTDSLTVVFGDTFDSIFDFINDKRIDVTFTEARIVFADGESETRSITGNTPYVFALNGVRAVKDVEFISDDLAVKYSDFFSEDLMEASETLDTADLFN